MHAGASVWNGFPGAVTRHEWPSRRRAAYALLVLFLAYVLSFVDRTIMSMMVAPIQRDLLLSDTGLSLLHGFAFVLFYTLAGLPLGRMVDTGSRRSIASYGVALWSVMTVTCGAVTGFGSLLAARIGVGIGEASLSPAAYSMLADYFPPQRRSLAYGLYVSGALLGAGLAFIGGGFLMASLCSGGAINVPGLGALSPWRLTFVIVGLPGLLVAALMLTVREPQRRLQRRARGGERSWNALLSHMLPAWRPYAVALLGFTVINLSFGALIVWGPSWLMRAYGLSEASVGIVMGMSFLIAGTMGLFAGGWLADQWIRRGVMSGNLKVGVISAVLAIPGFIGLGVATGPALASASLAFVAFSVASCLGAGPPALQLLCPNRLRGRMSAFYMLVLNLIGMGMGPTVVALMTDYVFGKPQAVGMSLAIAGVSVSLISAVILRLGQPCFEAAARQQQLRARSGMA